MHAIIILSLAAIALSLGLMLGRVCRTNDRLLLQISDLRTRIAYATDRRSPNAEAFIVATFSGYSVYLADPESPQPILIKRFPKADDPDFALLQAEELLERINETY